MAKTLEEAREDYDAHAIRLCVEGIEGAVDCAESCETLSDYKANLEEVISHAQALIEEAQEALAALRSKASKGER